MDGLAVSLITQVEERGGLTTCLPHCTEVSATYVKLKEKQESIGGKAVFLASTDVNNTKQKWRTEKNPRNSQNILLFYHPDEQGNIENFKIQVESVQETLNSTEN